MFGEYFDYYAAVKKISFTKSLSFFNSTSISGLRRSARGFCSVVGAWMNASLGIGARFQDSEVKNPRTDCGSLDIQTDLDHYETL